MARENNGRAYNTAELARMRAMELQWGWVEGAEPPKKRGKEEMAALKEYYDAFGKIPAVLMQNRHTRRNILRSIGALTPRYEKRRQQQMDA